MRAVNLLPVEPKRTRKAPTVVTQLAIVAPLVVGGVLAAGYLLASSQVNSKRATLTALQDELAAIPQTAQQPQQNPALASALQGRLGWDRVLRDLSAVLPGDVWLTKLSAQTPPVVPAPSATTTATTTSTTTTTTTTSPATSPPVATGEPLDIEGYTYSQEGVARFLTRLAVIPELQQVKLVSSAQSELLGRNVYSFSIAAVVQPQVTE